MHQQAEKNPINPNAQTLQREIRWFTKVLETRLQLYFRQGSEVSSIYEIPAPNLEKDETLYSQLLLHYQFGIPERLMLLLAMMPHLKPDVLDLFFTQNSVLNRPYTEFGGVNGKSHRGFLPTGETIMFLLTGGDLNLRLQMMPLLDPKHPLQFHHILEWGEAITGEPSMSRAVSISEEHLRYFMGEEDYQPAFGAEFPARPLTTRLQWEDLVVNPHTASNLEDILNWEREAYAFQLNARIQPGYRALFYGPMGSGKTLAATLLAEKAGKEIYRINLATIISKYIGETEKNLRSLFDRAERNEWVLFFDEADALFGKRTEVKDSHDRYANQEVSYFWDCLYAFRGLCIVAISQKELMDKELTRHFQSVVYFPLPNAEERLLLWQKAFEEQALDPAIDFKKIAQDYELTGAQINEVLSYSLVASAARADELVHLKDVLQGVRAQLSIEVKE